ncbi:outer membrane beta-barrel protein [Neiella sp. HB171785]|uniref:Outer membrane beta-barrel protein n=1 Tax=Neiella litorisoli TaxID=2771431 RepID=A0A8J6QIK7_9GAMM|nr:outer membrane beta-barrel protein [Neiella litorisoli]MBD1389363.1 outer membrane beta-barrel protein [Neiella litorisoli]
MNRLVFGLGIACLPFATPSYAQHKVSASGYFASIDFEFDNRDLEERVSSDEGSVHYTIRYHYDLSDTWAVGIGYLRGTSDTIENVFTALLGEDVEVEYKAIQLLAEARMPLSQRNFLFAEANLSRYDHDLLIEDETVTSSDGVGGGVGVGWEYRFDNGLGSRVSLSYDRLGDEVQLWSMGFGLSYRF